MLSRMGIPPGSVSDGYHRHNARAPAASEKLVALEAPAGTRQDLDTFRLRGGTILRVAATKNSAST